ncbi:hypothetical protein [Burkholderia gladioli]|uniref:ATP dependent DNA ligase n=1 Tax=Burkholderia gladioli TaxID=28095 RepID=UPI0031330699
MTNPPRGYEAKGVHWVKPELLAEVAYAQMTREGVVRHSVFHGLRTDKPAVDIEPERATPRRAVARRRDPAPAATGARGALDQVRITHPDRVIDAASGITKVELARYYAEISPWLLPHLRATGPSPSCVRPTALPGSCSSRRMPRSWPSRVSPRSGKSMQASRS